MVSEDRMTANERRAPGFLWPALIFLGTVFFAGIFAGYNAALAEAGKASLAPWAAALIAVALGAVALTLYFRRHAGWLRTLSPRRKRYWFSLGFAALIGGTVGILDQPGEGNSIGLLTGSALTPGSAIGVSIVWSLGLAVAMIIYHRAIDDHEKHAWVWASTWGWYAFIFTAPVWWVLHRAALAPSPDVMLLFLLSLVTNLMVYLWLKFR